jgi:hypothetical protein
MWTMISRPLILALSFPLVGACVDAPDTSSNREGIPTYEEFRDSWAHQMDDGIWIVNGDEPILDEETLRAFYDEMAGDGALIVNRVNNQDDKWSAAQVGNLTYCVSDKFGGSKAAIVQAVAQGAAKWEQASSAVNFVYVPSQDGSCNVRNNNVVFSVEPTKDPSIYARAFFPSYPRRNRNVLVNAPFTLDPNDQFTAEQILAHELGHTLGFRHEHTRPEAGTCFENNSWRALTAYDANSIMHYPQCNGGPNAMSFSSTDGAGCRALYGN